MRNDEMQKFLDLDERERRASIEAWKILENEIGPIISDFYSHLFANGFRDKFGNKNVEFLQMKQLLYWRKLFRLEFDDEYYGSVGRIWNIHKSIGVSLADYIASYAWFSERFFKVLGRSEPTPPHTRFELLSVTNRVIYIDMMIAASQEDMTSASPDKDTMSASPDKEAWQLD